MQHSGSIGRYQIRSRLGAGGFATVYRAHDPTLDREVALKVIHPHLARDGAIRSRFLREGRALARVRHPNVVQIHDAGEIGDVAYLAMELVEGELLSETLEADGPLPLARVLAIVDQIAAGLTAVHGRGLLHRDVKPNNIIVEEDSGRAVLLDLGIAHFHDSATMTATGFLMGTPGFMAPEQLDADEPLTARTDVYQLAATTYMMLSGRPPFRGDTVQVLLAIQKGRPPDLGDLRPDLPLPVVAAVMEGLAKDPSRRPPDAGGYATGLRRATQPFATAPSPDITQPWPGAGAPAPITPPVGGAAVDTAARTWSEHRPPRRDRRYLTGMGLGMAAGVLLLAVAGLVWYLLRPTPGTGEKTVGAATATAAPAETITPPAGAATAVPTATTVRTATAASTASATATRTPAPPSGTVLLRETFDSPATGRLAEVTGSSTVYRKVYDGGEFVISRIDPAYEQMPVSFVPGEFTNISMAVSARVAGDSSGQYVAVGCDTDDLERGYRMVLDPTAGSFAISRNDESLAPLVEWKDSSAIRRGNETNRMEIRCAGGKIEAVINGTQVASVNDSTYNTTRWWIGGGAFTSRKLTSEARFDDLVLTQR